MMSALWWSHGGAIIYSIYFFPWLGLRLIQFCIIIILLSRILLQLLCFLIQCIALIQFKIILAWDVLFFGHLKIEIVLVLVTHVHVLVHTAENQNIQKYITIAKSIPLLLFNRGQYGVYSIYFPIYLPMFTLYVLAFMTITVFTWLSMTIINLIMLHSNRKPRYSTVDKVFIAPSTAVVLIVIAYAVARFLSHIVWF